MDMESGVGWVGGWGRSSVGRAPQGHGEAGALESGERLWVEVARDLSLLRGGELGRAVQQGMVAVVYVREVARTSGTRARLFAAIRACAFKPLSTATATSTPQARRAPKDLADGINTMLFTTLSSAHIAEW
jgi:hypothetical protein